MNILIIDSDAILIQAIQEYFNNKDIVIHALSSYDDILEESNIINLHQFDAFILGIAKEKTKGLDVMEYLHLLNIAWPVLFISEDKDTNLMSMVFGRGGEDFLTLPLNLKELELRLTKALRKKVFLDDIALSAEYTFTFSEKSLLHNNFEIDLTIKQKELLYLFITHKNSLVSYEMIQDQVYHGKSFSNNAIATHIRDIRAKIKDINIKNVKGTGYILYTN